MVATNCSSKNLNYIWLCSANPSLTFQNHVCVIEVPYVSVWQADGDHLQIRWNIPTLECKDRDTEKPRRSSVPLQKKMRCLCKILLSPRCSSDKVLWLLTVSLGLSQHIFDIVPALTTMSKMSQLWIYLDIQYCRLYRQYAVIDSCYSTV